MRSRRTTVRRVVIVALATAWTATLGGCRGGDGEQAVPVVHMPAAAAFFRAYVAADGRVSRPDQRNDTVSEGQAYALLLAAATGDDAKFDRVWEWTREH